MTRIFLLPVLLLAVGGCADSTDRPEPAPPSSVEPDTASAARPDSIPPGFEVRGVYLGARYDSAAAVVSHEAVPGVMPAMRMPIRVADRTALRGLREGDKIRFRLVELDVAGYQMSEIEALPPETPLVLDDTTEAAVPEEAALPAAPTE